MAIVTGFEKDSAKKLHPTGVMVYWSMLVDPGKGPVFQIRSFRSGERKKLGSKSHTRQTLQFTQDSAHQLVRILRDEFKF